MNKTVEALGNNQLLFCSMLAKILKDYAYMPDSGVTYIENVLSFVAIPSFIFDDMIDRTKSENFAFSIEIPDENSLKTDVELNTKVSQAYKDILKKYLFGNRSLVYSREVGSDSKEGANA